MTCLLKGARLRRRRLLPKLREDLGALVECLVQLAEARVVRSHLRARVRLRSALALQVPLRQPAALGLLLELALGLAKLRRGQARLQLARVRLCRLVLEHRLVLRAEGRQPRQRALVVGDEPLDLGLLLAHALADVADVAEGAVELSGQLLAPRRLVILRAALSSAERLHRLLQLAAHVLLLRVRSGELAEIQLRTLLCALELGHALTAEERRTLSSIDARDQRRAVAHAQ